MGFKFNPFTGKLDIVTGDVVGPSSATDSVPPLFDGTTGKLLKNSTPTGTGNPVLQTSPSLTTPNIGVATATLVKYGSEVDNGNSGASDTIDWTLGNVQKSTITANCTYTFTAPGAPCHLTLRIIQDGTGNWTATLPTGKWSSGIVPLIKDTAGLWTIVNIYYDGSAYSYSINQNLS